jgi:hypothetical protein
VIRSRTCALLVIGALGLPARSAGRNSPIGSHKLVDVGDRHPPLYLGGGFNGEGASLDSVFLLMQARGNFTARVVVSWTDSGTVVYPRTTHGSWRLEGRSVVFSYAQVASTGGCWYQTCVDSSVADTGRVISDGISFHRFAGLGPSLLGKGAVLHFRRIAR